MDIMMSDLAYELYLDEEKYEEVRSLLDTDGDNQ
jgi:hypothetical protein